LYRTQVAGLPVDQRRLGSTQGVRAELERIETDARDPLADEVGVLARREAMTVAAATGKKEDEGEEPESSVILNSIISS
jgi:hypothetical protein